MKCWSLVYTIIYHSSPGCSVDVNVAVEVIARQIVELIEIGVDTATSAVVTKEQSAFASWEGIGSNCLAIALFS